MHPKFKLISIETNRLLLEPLKPEHANLLYEGFSEPDLYRFVCWTLPNNIQDLHNKFESMSQGGSERLNQIWTNWAVFSKENRQAVGFFESTTEGDKTFLAYYIFKNFQRQGLAKEGISAIINTLPQHYDIKKFVLEMDTRNRASFKLAESLDFVWKQTNNSVQELDGFQSHEFYYELELL